LSAAVLGIALMLQLTVVNRLPLPGGGAPDLVLLTVVALGLCGGPAGGALTGFCAGLALDIAPPGSYLIGQYALVFCLVGYLCGRLRGIANRSALLTIAAAMAAAATGEALSAAVGLAVSNPQVTWSAVRQVLPSSILYDVVLAPFVLYLVVRAVRLIGGLGRDAAAQPADGAALLARNQAAGGVLPGGSRSGAAPLGGAGLLGGVGWVSGPVRSRRSRGPRASRTGAAPRAPRTPRLGDAAARRGDGWLGSAPRTALSASQGPAARPGRPPRLRPGAGTAGSAVARRVLRSTCGWVRPAAAMTGASAGGSDGRPARR
jgi:rod shape-determining protein MreD